MAYSEPIANWMVAIDNFQAAVTALKAANAPAAAALTAQHGFDECAQSLSGTSWRQMDGIAVELSRMRLELEAFEYTPEP